MAWTLTDPTTATAVTLTPNTGDIAITHDRASGVLYPLRGASPFVQSGPLRAATINTPPLVFDTTVAWQSFITLAGLGRRMVLTDDMGGSWPVRVDGGIDTALLDTADRSTKPRYEVKVKFVGVA